ncbi:MAG: NAD-dependent 4,6-dehydratase LegB [bacterium]|nr:NAD-dependent 4,6-dehydratase LegB [bacterium]
MKRVLVTGAGGFIGSHLVEELEKRGYEVTAFVHYNSFSRWGWLDFIDNSVKKQIKIITGDITDYHCVKKAISSCDTIFHLAALIGIPYSYSAPDSYVDINIKGTVNILQAAKELNIKKIVHTSTSETYGTAQFVPISEKHPINPQSPYAASKAGADYLALSFYKSFGLPVAVARPFNTFGPRQSARAVIPTIISQLLKSNVVKLGSVDTTRDLTFVKDTVGGFIKIAETREAIGEVINIGSGFEISIADLVRMIAEIIGKKARISTERERKRPVKSEVERLWADTTKAKELLDWTPHYSLKEGLEQTIKWFRKNNSLYKADIYNV